MADYTPTTDVFGRFIEGLKMGMSMKKDEEATQRQLVEDQYKREANERANRTQAMQVNIASGGSFPNLESYDAASRYATTAPAVRGLEEILKSDVYLPSAQKTEPVTAPQPSLYPLLAAQNKPSTTEDLIIDPAQLGIQKPEERAPAIPITNVVNPTTPKTGYSRPYASEEEVQQHMRAIGGLENMRNTALNMETTIDPNTGATVMKYMGPKGDVRVKTISQRYQSATGGPTKVPTLEEAAELAKGIHDGVIEDKFVRNARIPIAMAYMKLYPGESMATPAGVMKAAGSTMARRAINTIDSIIYPSFNDRGEKTQESLLEEFKKAHDAIGMASRGEYGPATMLLNDLKAQYKLQMGDTDVQVFNALKNALAAEISSALSAGGVPTDKRMEVELSNLTINSTPEAFNSVIDRSYDVLKARREAFAATKSFAEREELYNKLQKEIDKKYPPVPGLTPNANKPQKGTPVQIPGIPAAGSETMSFEEFTKGGN